MIWIGTLFDLTVFHGYHRRLKLLKSFLLISPSRIDKLMQDSLVEEFRVKSIQIMLAL